MKWNEYITTLRNRPFSLSDEYIDVIKNLRQTMYCLIGSEPAAGPGGERGFFLIWYKIDYYLHIDISGDGKMEWFLHDKNTKKTSSGEKLEQLTASLKPYHEHECQNCNGTGRVDNDDCFVCDGDGGFWFDDTDKGGTDAITKTKQN